MRYRLNEAQSSLQLAARNALILLVIMLNKSAKMKFAAARSFGIGYSRRFRLGLERAERGDANTTRPGRRSGAKWRMFGLGNSSLTQSCGEKVLALRNLVA